MVTVDSSELDKFINHVALSSRPFPDAFNKQQKCGGFTGHTAHMRAGDSDTERRFSVRVSQDSSGPRVYLAWAWESAGAVTGPLVTDGYPRVLVTNQGSGWLGADQSQSRTACVS